TWIGSFQNFTGTDTTTTDPRLLFVIQGPGSVATPANSHSTYANGDDNPNFFYSLTVQPGETQILMLYSGLFASRAPGTNDVNTIFKSNDTVASNGLLAGLSPTQRSEIVNWDISANTTTTVASSANPSFFGQPVTFTATVTNGGIGTPTGTV